MKICTVVGARPQFIKAAALSRVLRRQHEEVLIHTGQHYDHNMSDIFFDELSIPRPDYNLGIAGGSHGKMTGEMLIAIEEVLQKERPDMVLVFGDTNSTLAGALAAVKLHLPICHVEAGVRMETLQNPEEVNRVLTDRISALLLCCTETAIGNLRAEGITRGVYNTGDLMYDAVLYYGKRLTAPRPGDLMDFSGKEVALPEKYVLLTCHREENTGTDEPLDQIFSAMEALPVPVVYPVHPRNHERAQRLCQEKGYRNILLTQPVGYLTSLYLVSHADQVVTDSGGLQREAWFLGRQCITLLDNPPWPETLEGNVNQLCRPDKEEILRKLSVRPDFSRHQNQFGDGHAAEKITEILSAYQG
ncbi:non-hydrolyzing UDP-N-acetylglucosamine 2-epimerase [Zongyangia hominis]|uniref:UDP-N-acetylglucosamine 2-epimerase (Non-hydrolyzing) n=1 Tax=Zongyangia hominis TaxID=2763677 RepID=A0A926IBT2_9FIRM|nr:UDP-N-acetylglucosamine 2-epimerase (non-hydrolyzing) [Zongyangia hominis]MBC8570405.1 UDP-N-acetylglucosamine 2-epimerase (non-hydrolyzing) [Zongyangia hominis]